MIEARFRPSPKAVEDSFRNLSEDLERRTSKRTTPLILYTDEKKDYRRALKKSSCCSQKISEGNWHHRCVSSRDLRNRSNPLFPVNYIDREFRKDMSNHARETVQFSRNVNNAMLRMGLYLFDHNFIKPYRVADREERKFRHAEKAGLDRGSLEAFVDDFYRVRCRWREDHRMEDWAFKTINRRWVTPLKEGSEKVWGCMGV